MIKKFRHLHRHSHWDLGPAGDGTDKSDITMAKSASLIPSVKMLQGWTAV